MSEAISKHIFLLPFRWAYKSKDTILDKISLRDRNNIEEISNYIITQNWTRKKFDQKDIATYNQTNYLHDFIEDIAFDKNTRNGIVHLVYNIDKSKKNNLYVHICNQSEPYKLPIESINVKIFKHGVAILYLEIINFQYDDFSDILRINEYTRRIYPQYLPVNSVKENFLPDKVELEINDEIVAIEDFTGYNLIPAYIQKLLGKSFKYDKQLVNKSEFYINPAVDDRMFVICWASNDNIISQAKSNIDNKEWYKYIFIDKKEPSIANETLRKQLLESHTYQRWKDDDQLYGVTRYSMMALTSEEKYWVRYQMETNYFNLAFLVIAQRAHILKFTDEVSILLREKLPVSDISMVQEQYLHFLNNIYFTEVTAQEQGIEVYTMLQHTMDIEKQANNLKEKISELHNYANTVESYKLSLLATIFLPASIVLSIFGLSQFPELNFSNGNLWDINIVIPIVIAAITSVLTWLIFKPNRKK